MARAWGVQAPVRAEDFPGPEALEKRLLRCSCGCLSFLPLPCPVCGKEVQEPAFRFARRRARAARLRRWMLAVPFTAVCCVLAWVVWPPLTLVPCGVILASLLFKDIRHSGQEDLCYWLFHDGTGKPERFTEAYRADFARLERMLEEEPSAQRAWQVWGMAEGLASVYHNRRLSELLLRCLLRMPASEGAYVDVDMVCAWLEPEDLPDYNQALAKLDECAAFTCLRLGRPTARFVVRACAVRIPRFLLKWQQYQSRSLRAACGGFSQDFSLKPLFSPEERRWLSRLWYASASGAPGSSSRAEVRPEDSVLLGELAAPEYAVAECWYRHAWYDGGSPERLALVNMFRDQAREEGEA